jgi:aspartyl-tRNA(Asn)/glutamyl-tRNA(Gln) amidotransferase subunit B
MEEDTGKNIHDAHGDASLVDYNRSGVPLLEIVSEPDMRSAAEAGAYLRKLRAILQYLEVCDGNMEEGSFRCDANVSVRPFGETKLGTKVEIKNMNSFRNVERALDFEYRRQVEALESGGKLVQETRLWDANREVTRSMRSKEHAHDYRYFPEPDLLPLLVDQAWIEQVRSTLPELPDARRQRFVSQYRLPEYDAEVLIARKDVADYFEDVVRAHGDAKAASNWVMGDVLRLVRERKLDDVLVIRDWPVAASHLAALLGMIDGGQISGKIAKTVFEEMAASGESPQSIVAAKGLTQVSDDDSIHAAIRSVLDANRDKVEEYRGGKDKLFGFFVGQVMKATQGKANPQKLNELLRQQLGA